MQFVVWGIVGILGLSVVTAFARVSGSAVLAVLHDMLPTNLVLAWVVLGIGLITRNWALAVTAALLAGWHIGLIVTRRTVDETPGWVASAPRLRLAVANVNAGLRSTLKRLGIKVIAVRKSLAVPLGKRPEEVQRVFAGPVIEVAVVVVREGRGLPCVFLARRLHSHPL